MDSVSEIIQQQSLSEPLIIETTSTSGAIGRNTSSSSSSGSDISLNGRRNNIRGHYQQHEHGTIVMVGTLLGCNSHNNQQSKFTKPIRSFRTVHGFWLSGIGIEAETHCSHFKRYSHEEPFQPIFDTSESGHFEDLLERYSHEPAITVEIKDNVTLMLFSIRKNL